MMTTKNMVLFRKLSHHGRWGEEDLGPFNPPVASGLCGMKIPKFPSCIQYKSHVNYLRVHALSRFIS